MHTFTLVFFYSFFEKNNCLASLLRLLSLSLRSVIILFHFRNTENQISCILLTYKQQNKLGKYFFHLTDMYVFLYLLLSISFENKRGFYNVILCFSDSKCGRKPLIFRETEMLNSTLILTS